MTQTIVMTGATSGLGVAWLKKLAAQQTHEIYVLARNQTKLETILSAMPSAQSGHIHFVHCELDSFSSIRQAVKQLERLPQLDVLINNAGVFSGERRSESQDGFELTFAVNHLAPFLLSNLLLDLLSKSASARVINTASFQHAPASFDWEDLTYQHREFDATQAYQHSKLANVAFTLELAKRLQNTNSLENTNIIVNCFDPGIVNTPMTLTALPPLLRSLYPVLRYFFRSLDKGAETGLYLSLDEAVAGRSGGYYRDKMLKDPSAAASSLKNAQLLWEYSEGFVGQAFPL